MMFSYGNVLRVSPHRRGVNAGIWHLAVPREILTDANRVTQGSR